jgi:hypothetical protein
MKEPKSKVAAPRQKKAATNSKEKTSSNEAYLKLLSNLKAKLAIAEPEAFAIWQASKRSEDLANWLQAQNQLRITATHLGKRSEVEVGVYE